MGARTTRAPARPGSPRFCARLSRPGPAHTLCGPASCPSVAGGQLPAPRWRDTRGSFRLKYEFRERSILRAAELRHMHAQSDSSTSLVTLIKEVEMRHKAEAHAHRSHRYSSGCKLSNNIRLCPVAHRPLRSWSRLGRLVPSYERGWACLSPVERRPCSFRPGRAVSACAEPFWRLADAGGSSGGGELGRCLPPPSHQGRSGVPRSCLARPPACAGARRRGRGRLPARPLLPQDSLTTTQPPDAAPCFAGVVSTKKQRR